MAESLVTRGLKRMRSLVSGAGATGSRLPAKQAARLREQLRECAAGLGGEVSARIRAARLGETYQRLDEAGRHEFLRMIALEFGPDPKAVDAAHRAYQAARDTPGRWDAEAALRSALRSSRIRILTQFNALPQGVKFLVDLRADLLRYLETDRELAVLDRELESRLSAWFDVGFLELDRLTWHSPAALLEKLIRYEAVHEIRSWNDLRNRLDSDRRLYAFFHPRMPMEPLIFVEVALTDKLADDIHLLLDETAPLFDPKRADTAIFYSISNTQKGLRGVSFGNFLLKRVVDDLKRDFPRLSTFATLSPMPQLTAWLGANPDALAATGLDLAHLQEGAWAKDKRLERSLRDPLRRIAARYLVEARNGTRTFDPVARFHFGNGARIERINWLADTSERGFGLSLGMMVNYLYDPDEIEENVEAYVGSGRIATSAAVRRLAAP
ncbi:MAG TPA: Malonyl-CoA decarboxylase [Rhodocyclaceae bacterium]|nr:MAG: Malonyl-CoA decarboxylase [Betaproteobacteria bacterium CG2_30_68_42]PIV72280.1 MAG: Malonyl-CoA decarboxylase [Rhodocyclales bacterium CG17_big_fil_post_rev_8_21_14_2_50_68_7]PIX75193.1 MAG: Malonyl-CoA decarboxylase [Rhodocyclales bacterium CG_4_10_14_3_um_filter_68_10]PJA57283.1 MAG: Malonyl-CoA decarboxylase [Rhodocyclales bacterium CG_4_9_14_3_um_filter_68_10]HCX34282.1 Malonyl-CoA decarboxylase [Rhodocyclaceae bacterium]